jgi:hypothetical protein
LHSGLDEAIRLIEALALSATTTEATIAAAVEEEKNKSIH